MLASKASLPLNTNKNFMQSRGIDASLSTNNLTFRPGSVAVSFEVTVFNVSELFAAFQIEVVAAGANRNPKNRWYKLSPEVSAAKPPGSSTVFQIVIIDTPLPGFVGAVNLTVCIFSPQLRQERKFIVRLTIEPGTGRSLLQVILPVQQFQVYPRNLIAIPVQVRNLSPHPSEVVLQLTRLNPSWIINSTERRLFVDPGSVAETSFQCQPPVATQALSQIYPFTLIATSQDNFTVQADGTLDVLPVGFVEFSTKNPKRTIPMKGGWFPNWKSSVATFDLLLKNTSNLQQQVNLQVQGSQQRRWKYKVIPENADLRLGETTNVLLETTVKRHWLGLGKTLRLEVKTLLSDQRLGSTTPATQPLELQIRPIVPLWLSLAVLAILAVILLLLFKPEPIAHTATVNTLSVKGSTAVSGADDCTIRRWKILGDRLQPQDELSMDDLEELKQKEIRPLTCRKPIEPKGVLAIADEPVVALQVLPDESNRVAIGLLKGGIELRDLGTGEWIQNVTEGEQEVTIKTDRLYAMAVTEQANYLFSGYASGKIRVWRRSGINKQFEFAKSLAVPSRLQYVIQALALSPDESQLVAAGEKNSLIVWERSWWQQVQAQNHANKLVLSDKLNSNRQNNTYFDVAFLPNNSNLFATADSGGFITIWDLNQCQAIKNSSVNTTNDLGFAINSNLTVKELNQPATYQCQERDRWQASSQAIRSIDFSLSQDGRLLLASAGNQGQVVLWTLTSEGELVDRQATVTNEKIYQSPDKHKAQSIYSTDSNQAIRSIKLILGKKRNVIVSGGEDRQNGYFQVKLHSIP